MEVANYRLIFHPTGGKISYPINNSSIFHSWSNQTLLRKTDLEVGARLPIHLSIFKSTSARR